MEWWSKMTVPVRKAWFGVSKRLGIRKTGLLKLRHDVRTCEYEDVHVLWDLLKKNESGLLDLLSGAKGTRVEYFQMGQAGSIFLPKGLSGFVALLS